MAIGTARDQLAQSMVKNQSKVDNGPIQQNQINPPAAAAPAPAATRGWSDFLGGYVDNTWGNQAGDEQFFGDPNSNEYIGYVLNGQTDAAKYLRGQQTPQQLLNLQLRQDANNFRKNLDTTKAQSSDLLRQEANQSIKAGTRNIRKGANSRGLLYSNIREGSEQSLKGKVSGLLAQQMNQSNNELDKMAQNKDAMAADAALSNYSNFLQQQSEMENERARNQVMRNQQMQQITGAMGYVAGNAFGGGSQGGNSAPARSQMMSGGGQNGNYITNGGY